MHFLRHLAEDESQKESAVREAEKKAMQRLQEIQAQVKTEAMPQSKPVLTAKPRSSQKRHLSVVKRESHALLAPETRPSVPAAQSKDSEQQAPGHKAASEATASKTAPGNAGVTALLSGYDSSGSDD